MPDVATTSSLITANGRGRVVDAISRAAASSGVDFNFLFNQAKIESGLNPGAHARTSTASGLYQFTQQTWLGVLKAHGAENSLTWASNAISKESDGRYVVSDPNLQSTIYDLRKQPEAAAAMAAASAADNRDYLSTHTGSPATPVALYLAHFLGPAAASRFIAAYNTESSQAAAPLFPEAAASNRPIFYNADGSQRSLAAIYDNFAAKLEMTPGSAVTEFTGASTSDLSPQSLSLMTPTAYQPPILTTQVSNNDQTLTHPLEMMAIEPMPRHLSLRYAQQTYARLAALDRGNG